MAELIFGLAIAVVVFLLMNVLATYIGKWQHIRHGTNRHGLTTDWYGSSQRVDDEWRRLDEEMAAAMRDKIEQAPCLICGEPEGLNGRCYNPDCMRNTYR